MALRILIADDSELFADAVRYIIEQDPELQVVGVAPDGLAATMSVGRLKPDIIIMDVQMPVMDGLEAIERIMSTRPTPILVMTADPRGESGELSLEALKRGALDLVQKPMAFPQPEKWGRNLREKLRLLASVAVVRHMAPRSHRHSSSLESLTHSAPTLPSSPSTANRRHTPPEGRPAARRGPVRAAGIVASTGGPAALARILERLPADLPFGIAIVQHMSPGFTEGLVDWLNRASALDVRLARAGERMHPGRVWIAPDARHLQIRPGGELSLSPSDPVDGHRPSGTVLLHSMAQAYRSSCVGVVLTGMGGDGARGLLDIREAGGRTVAQDKASCAVYGMPAKAAELNAAERILPLSDIADHLVLLGRRGGT